MTRTTPELLASALCAARAPERRWLVCIDGAGGSGKSTIARALAAARGDVQVIEQDDFFRPSAERAAGPLARRPHGADFDLARLRAEVLEPLRAGRPAAYRRYDWRLDALAAAPVPVTQPIVIVEGVYSASGSLGDFFDVRVWVECPRALRLARGLARDGLDARSRWEEDWMPSEDRYIAEEHPAAAADWVLDGEGDDPTREILVLRAPPAAGAPAR